LLNNIGDLLGAFSTIFPDVFIGYVKTKIREKNCQLLEKRRHEWLVGYRISVRIFTQSAAVSLKIL
jgi:hypothetical protein